MLVMLVMLWAVLGVVSGWATFQLFCKLILLLVEDEQKKEKESLRKKYGQYAIVDITL